jgi:hypothetical protein
MSTLSGGPNIVVDGLVLALDAANTKSYVSGSTAWNDLSRGGNNGTLINGPTFNTGSGGNIVFDGVDDYVNTTYFGSSTSDYTFSVWYNPLNSVSTTPLTRGRDGMGSGWSLLLGSDSSVGNRYRAGVVTGFGGYVAYSNTSLILNKWVYLTGVWISSNSINLYVNGIFNNTVSVPGNNLRTSTDGWVLGSITTSFYTNIQIASTQIYNRILSAQEILQNYNATKTRFGL